MSTEKCRYSTVGTGYQHLLQEEHLYLENQQPSSSFQDVDLTPPPTCHSDFKRRWMCVSTLAAKASIIALAILGLATLLQLTLLFDVNAQDVDCNCGSSIEEAIARGCKYDAMATSWLPPACRDDELANEFDHAGPGPDGEWGYYADKHGNVSYTLEEVAMLAANDRDEDRGFWTTHEWHIAHCMFYWRKESRARLFKKSAIEKSFSGEYHTDHCRDIFLSCRPLQEINTLSHVGLNSDVQGDEA